MSTRIPVASSAPRHAGTPVKGLPRMNYYLPVIVTFLAAVFSFFLVALLMFFAAFNVITQAGHIAAGRQDISLGAIFCGLASVVCAIGTVYFFVVVIKAFRDIFSPIYYTRGVIADKRVLGGRKSGTWLGVIPRYAGPDLTEASTITEEQRLAHPDRSQVFEPRYNPKKPEPSMPPKPGSAYLPVDRISSSRSIDPSDLPLRVIFRVDPASHAALEPDDEVLLAHSRYLHHIFYVAHLKGGDWESYPNKALI